MPTMIKLMPLAKWWAEPTLRLIRQLHDVRKEHRRRDHLGNVRLAVVVAPDVADADKRRDVEIGEFAVHRTDFTADVVGESRACQCLRAEGPMQRVELQREILAALQIYNRFRPADRLIVTFTLVQPLVINRCGGEDRADAMLVVLPTGEHGPIHCAAAEDVQRRERHPGSVTVTDEADGMIIRHARDEIGHVQAVSLGPATELHHVSGEAESRGFVAGPGVEHDMQRPTRTRIPQPGIGFHAVSKNGFPLDKAAVHHETDRRVRNQRRIEIVDRPQHAPTVAVALPDVKLTVLAAIQAFETAARTDNPVVVADRGDRPNRRG